MKDKQHAVLMIVLLFCFMIGVWLLDISVTTMNVGGVLTNGFTFVNPAKTYHIGLGLMISTMILTMFLLVEERYGP